jgi:hypothetical protein
MIGDYTIYERSMNGVKTLSDGISYITNGTATHDTITYNNLIQSGDQLTILTNDTVTTVNVDCNTLDATNTNIGTVNANIVDCNRFYVRDISENVVVDFNGSTNNLSFNGISNFNNTINITNKDVVQTQTGKITQSGTNANSLKDTNINGFLTVGSNITQNGGSTSLKDVTCDNLTIRAGKSITQSGTGTNNIFSGTSTIKDLIILDSVVFPSSVVVPGTTTSGDIVMQNDSVIIQDLTVEPSGKTNILRTTRTLDLEVDGDLDMIKGGATATLKNTIIQGSAEIQGDITQTTGATILKTISCNNITLNADQNITQSGTGYITQSGSGTNTMKAIDLTNNSNLSFYGNGIISQPLNTSQNILNNFRCAGYGIVGGRNNTTFTNTQNIQNNTGIQFQFNRDNSTQYSFLMNNRGSGGNGGFRIQRYVGGVYLDEPMVIDDNITMNKNLSVPGGSISCSSATLGNISQTEIDCLNNCSVNIQTEFNTINSEIDSLQNTSSGNTIALTGISYVSATDTTLIDNNLTVSSGKNLLVGTTNVTTEINTLKFTLSGFTYDASQDLDYIDNNVTLAPGKNLVVNNTNISTAINTLNTNASGITYTSGTDTTTIDNNVTINKTLIVEGMNLKAEIDALDVSFTTGTINSTDLTTSNLYVNNTAKFGQVGGSTLVKNDMRFCNVVNKSESEMTQFYQTGTTMSIVNQQNNGSLSYLAKNNSGVITEYLRINPTSFNVKNTNVDIDTNLNVDGTTTLAATTASNLTVTNNVTVNNDLIVNDTFIVTDSCQTYPNTVASTNFSENASLTVPYTTTPTADLATIVISEPFTKEINLNLSLSGGLLWRNGYISPSNLMQYTTKIENFRLSIWKNGVLWQNNVTIHNAAELFAEYTFRFSYTQTNVYMNYYLDTILIKFEPDIQTTPTVDSYTIRCAFDYTYTLQNYDLTTETLGAFTGSFTAFNTAVYSNVPYTYNQQNISLTSTSSPTFNIITYSPPTYITTNYSINYNVMRFGMNTNSKKELQCVNFSAQNENVVNSTITNAGISNLALSAGYVTNNLRCKTFVAGYLVNGSTTSWELVPIFCSLNGIVPNNAADYFFVMPGFKFELYDGVFYATLIDTIENTYDYTELFQVSGTANRVSSIKVFYRPTNSSAYQEIRYLPLSADVNGN